MSYMPSPIKMRERKDYVYKSACLERAQSEDSLEWEKLASGSVLFNKIRMDL